MPHNYDYLAGESGGEVLWWVCLYLCVCLSVREDISGTTRAIFTKYLCMLPMVVARSPPAGWRNLKGKGQFWGFLPHWQCIVTLSLRKGSLNIGREGVMGVHSACDLWLPCFHCNYVVVLQWFRYIITYVYLPTVKEIIPFSNVLSCIRQWWTRSVCVTNLKCLASLVPCSELVRS